MAVRYITIQFPNGWLGENSDWPGDMLLPGQLSSTKDVVHASDPASGAPELSKRGGEFREPNATVSAGLSLVAGFTATYSSSNPGQKLIVQGHDGRFWQTSAGMTGFTAMGTSSFSTLANFSMLGDIVAIATNGNTLIGTSGTDHVFALDAGLTGVSAAPAARYIVTYKNRFHAAGQPTSADEVKWTAVGATTGLPTPTDWYSTGNAGNRIFSQGEGFNLIGLAATEDRWYAFKRNRSFAVIGSTPTSYVTDEADRDEGFYHKSIANVGRGLIGCNESGIHSLLNGRIEPLLPDRMMRYWASLALSDVSSFQGAWSPSRSQYRIRVKNGSTWEMLTGVLMPNRPIAWYRWNIFSQCLFIRQVEGGVTNFYRGGSVDGFLYRMDMSAQDASAAINASFRTGIQDDGAPYIDKRFRKAWIFGRTRGSWQLSATFTVHAEGGKMTPINTYRFLGLSAARGDIARGSFLLDGQRGWGIDCEVFFDPNQAGSIHKIVIEYEDDTDRYSVLPGVPIIS